MAIIIQYVDILVNIIWSYILVFSLIGGGLFFTFMMRGAQFRMFRHMFVILFKSRNKTEGISSFQAFSISIASRVGVGNIGGVAAALVTGGPGAILWMWITALLGMATSLVESILAQVYKVPDGDKFCGGPAYYIERGLNMKPLAVLFAISVIFTFGIAITMIQAVAITDAITHAAPTGFFSEQRWFHGVWLAGLTALIIIGGVRSIAKTAELMVPFMALFYLIISLIVVLANLGGAADAIILVVKAGLGLPIDQDFMKSFFTDEYNALDAVSLQTLGGGVLGYAISTTISKGVGRGLFSNEAGLGSAPNAAGIADVKHPVSQGLVQSFGVFVDTIVICTCTAAVILIAGQMGSFNTGSDGSLSYITGVPLTQLAFSDFYGNNIGAIFIAVALFFFSFTSILSNVVYTNVNLRYLCPTQKSGDIAVAIARYCTLIFIVLASMSQFTTVLAFADLSMGIMAVLNIIGILMLAPVAFLVLKDYEQQRKSGIDEPIFSKAQYPQLEKSIHHEIW